MTTYLLSSFHRMFYRMLSWKSLSGRPVAILHNMLYFFLRSGHPLALPDKSIS